MSELSINKGYIKLHRQFHDHPLWKERRIFSRAEAWIDIIANIARGTPDKILKRGEFQASMRDLAYSWQWTKPMVQRFLEYLVAENMIVLVREGGSHSATVYGVVNYGRYNGEIKTAKTPAKPAVDTKSDTKSDTKNDTPNQQIPLADSDSVDTKFDTKFDTKSDTKPPAYKEEKKDKEGLKKENVSPAEKLSLGEFRHTQVTAVEFEKLKTELGPHFDYYIQRFDDWFESGAIKARSPTRNHYLTIRSWYRRDLNEGKLRGKNGSESRAEQRERKNREATDRAATDILGRLGFDVPDGNHAIDVSPLHRNAIGNSAEAVDQSNHAGREELAFLSIRGGNS